MRATAATLALFGIGIGGCNADPKYPTVESCSALPVLDNYREPDAISLPLRFENHMGAFFRVIGVCIDVDGRRIRQDDAEVTAGFATHRPLELRVGLRPNVPHRVTIITLFAGTGAFAEYKFLVSSSHDIGAEELTSETLQGKFVEKGDLPPEQRPTVEWTGPGKKPPSP